MSQEIISPKYKDVEAIFVGVRYLGYENEFIVVPEEGDEWEMMPNRDINIQLRSNGQNEDIVLESRHRQMYSIRTGTIRRPTTRPNWQTQEPSALSGRESSSTLSPAARLDPQPPV